MANIAARKKLSALYARGVALRFTPEGPKFADPDVNRGAFPEDDKAGPDDVEVWIAPPNPHQREMALREGQAARARALLKVKNDPESEEHLTTKAFLADMSFETLVDYMIVNDQQERLNEAMRSVLGEDEWENFPELQDAMRQYDEAVAAYEETGTGVDPRTDPEFNPLREADARFAKAVDEREHEMREAARESMILVGRDELERRAMERRGEMVGSQAFAIEYEDHMRFYSVREPDNRNALFFENVRALREADDVVRDAIVTALRMFITEGAEAKN